MRSWEKLKKAHEMWASDVSGQINKLPNKVDRLRLLIEVEKASLLSEIAQGISCYHDSQ